MPRKSIGPELLIPGGKRELAERLAAELKNSREFGQPSICERTYRTGKSSVLVIWDAWNGMSLQERTATILRAYEMAEGRESRERVALASELRNYLRMQDGALYALTSYIITALLQSI